MTQFEKIYFDKHEIVVEYELVFGDVCILDWETLDLEEGESPPKYIKYKMEAALEQHLDEKYEDWNYG